eukprot:TRINITY_DN2211_c0_g1_i1.p1 TRINITY_DN2211_c0_g1~~TRINITY_DN2211_c0_g1_i1.p1  ORF type:complete len:324 (-),score=-2.24 TRINITY_DN2211_c0_g1_i1:219-1142(-)
MFGGPAGPYRKPRLDKSTRTIALIFALLAFMCFLFSLLALVLPEWLRGEYGVFKRKIGLWRICGYATGNVYNYDCVDMLWAIPRHCPQNEDTFRALQAVLIIGVISFFLSIALVPLGALKFKMNLLILGIIFTALGFVSSVAVLVTFYYEVEQKDWACQNQIVTHEVTMPHDWGSAWYLLLAAAIMAFVAVVVSILAAIRVRKIIRLLPHLLDPKVAGGSPMIRSLPPPTTPVYANPMLSPYLHSVTSSPPMSPHAASVLSMSSAPPRSPSPPIGPPTGPLGTHSSFVYDYQPSIYDTYDATGYTIA